MENKKIIPEYVVQIFSVVEARNRMYLFALTNEGRIFIKVEGGNGWHEESSLKPLLRTYK